MCYQRRYLLYIVFGVTLCHVPYSITKGNHVLHSSCQVIKISKVIQSFVQMLIIEVLSLNAIGYSFKKVTMCFLINVSFYILAPKL